MGRRWPEAPAKNVQEKTTEEVGRKSWRLREGENLLFLHANTLHVEEPVALRMTFEDFVWEWPPPR